MEKDKIAEFLALWIGGTVFALIAFVNCVFPDANVVFLAWLWPYPVSILVLAFGGVLILTKHDWKPGALTVIIAILIFLWG